MSSHVQTFQNLVNFERNAALIASDFWNYQNFGHAVEPCLEALLEVYGISEERPDCLSLHLLRKAYQIHTNPLFYGPNQEVIQHREITVKAGKKVTEIFQKTCLAFSMKPPRTDGLDSILEEQWKAFISPWQEFFRLEKEDQKEALRLCFEPAP